MLYIYDTTSIDGVPVMESLLPERLLVPPIFTNNLPWTRGYFETIRNVELKSSDVLKAHCFKFTPWPDAYFNDDGVRVPKSQGPIGVYGLDSFLTIDDAVSEAMGIPKMP